jgi:hypothetical protein
MSAPRRLLPALVRAYSSIGARAGEKVVPVNNAFRTQQGVIDVRPSCLVLLLLWGSFLLLSRRPPACSRRPRPASTLARARAAIDGERGARVFL